jgi:hypothetical protein
MNREKLQEIVGRIERGELDLVTALAELDAPHSVAELGFARIDCARQSRCGFPEFVFGQNKSALQLTGIIREIRKRKQPVLVTRLKTAAARPLLKKFPDAEYDELAGVLIIRPKHQAEPAGKIVIVTGGTTDLPVALEAKHTAEICGCAVELLADSGVAGLHRLMAKSAMLRQAEVIIAVAGMEGALPSVIGGMVACPVIAVPTSVGYGASLGGLAALFAMLNSCASGVTVVNIDNGFGAGCAAARIILSKKSRKT